MHTAHFPFTQIRLNQGDYIAMCCAAQLLSSQPGFVAWGGMNEWTTKNTKESEKHERILKTEFFQARSLSSKLGF